MAYDLSKFSVISVKKCENDDKKEERCERCNEMKDRFVSLKECGHVFCRDCVDELYDLYDQSLLEKDKTCEIEMFLCPKKECCLKIYDIIYI